MVSLDNCIVKQQFCWT
uniref:Uncharacterized protein n=1 Tax=Arundo donax TaxID=35708 RepID=A0A0A9GV40_ARUDO